MNYPVKSLPQSGCEVKKLTRNLTTHALPCFLSGFLKASPISSCSMHQLSSRWNLSFLNYKKRSTTKVNRFKIQKANSNKNSITSIDSCSFSSSFSSLVSGTFSVGMSSLLTADSIEVKSYVSIFLKTFKLEFVEHTFFSWFLSFAVSLFFLFFRCFALSSFWFSNLSSSAIFSRKSSNQIKV